MDVVFLPHIINKPKRACYGGTHDPNTQEADAEGLLWMPGQPNLHAEYHTSRSLRARPVNNNKTVCSHRGISAKIGYCT